MGTIELILTSISLSIDAFAVSICKGLSNNKFNIKNSLIIGTYFGLFQGIMPLIGYLIGKTFTDIIISIDHYIAFIFLGIIGINMVKEGLSKNIENINDKIESDTNSRKTEEIVKVDDIEGKLDVEESEEVLVDESTIVVSGSDIIYKESGEAYEKCWYSS